LDITIETLSADEQADLETQERIIAGGLDTFQQVGEALLAIRDRRLYRAKFTTWEGYCQERWGFTGRRGNQYVLAAQVVSQLRQVGTIVPMMESHARPLAALPDLAQKYAAMEIAQQSAAVSHRAVTSDDVAAAVRVVKKGEVDADRKAVYASQYAPVVQKMQLGAYPPARARLICEALDSSEPPVRGEMLHHQVADTTIIREMNRLFREKRESYGDITRSGYLQFLNDTAIALSEARPVDLRRYLDERRRQHRLDAAATTIRLETIGMLVEVDTEQSRITFQLTPDVMRGLVAGQRYRLTVEAL